MSRPDWLIVSPNLQLVPDLLDRFSANPSSFLLQAQAIQNTPMGGDIPVGLPEGSSRMIDMGWFRADPIVFHDRKIRSILQISQ